MNVNKCTLVGRLTKDAEYSTTKSNLQMSKFRLAVNNRRNENTLYVNVVVFGQLAETLQPKLIKGRITCVIGPLSIDEYENDQKEKRTSVCIMADTIELGPDPDKILKSNTGSDDPGLGN